MDEENNKQISDSGPNLDSSLNSFSRENFYARRKNSDLNSKGYRPINNYNPSSNNDEKMKATLERIKYKQKRETAKKAISEGISATSPLAGAAVDKVLDTPQGEKILDEYAKGDTPAEGVRNVKRYIDRKKRTIRLILLALSILLPIFIIAFLVSIIFKNADTQIFSNENGGTYESEYYQYDDPNLNIFKKYPGLYEHAVDKIKKVSDQYQMDVDKILVISTLIAPIENGLITPVQDGSCGEENCYYLKNKSYTWTEFLKVWGDQAELLSKMQMLTYVNYDANLITCKGPETMEQYAQNDFEIREHYLFWWINPLNWFSTFRDAVDAEINARCTSPRNGSSVVPIVRVISTEQAEYYPVTTNDSQDGFVKDPNSGGVYYWNLVNKNGFIHEYLKDYLSDEYKDDIDKNYEVNKRKIVEVANYIYSYYESIRKDCNGFQVMHGQLDKIDFQEDAQSTIYTLDFEDAFVGGSVLATYGGATGEVARAQAIITRSEAYNYIVVQKKDVIIGTAKMGCWWWKYNPTYDPSYENQEDNPNYDPDYPKIHYPEIYKAVTETRGIVVTSYGDDVVLETQYDAFCPTTREPIGGFYYLPDGQNNLPIDTSRFNVPKSRVECPCFQNKGSRPDDQYAERPEDIYPKLLGNPPQTTTEKCWEPNGKAKTTSDGTVLSGYKYKATGGHGEGVSQHGMAYFSQFGYDRYALIKLFLERNGYGISFKRYDTTIEENECKNHGYFSI